MSSRLIRPNVGMAVVKAATEKIEKWDREDTAAIATARKARMQRRAQLEEQAAAIKRATDRYEFLDRGEQPEIRIRRTFVRLDPSRPPEEDEAWPETVREKLKADVDSRPPLTKLIHRPSNALQMYLSLLYVAQLEFEPGTRWTNERDNTGRGGWGELCGLRVPAAASKELNLRVTRALGKLADHDLVRVGEWKSRNRFDGFNLHREDKQQTYFTPSASESRSLPAAFFRAGWHLVLTNNEMATLLAVLEQTGQPRARRDAELVGVALPLSMRWRFYGLAPEAFAARHELEEFGLIEQFDPMDRTDGKLSPTQRQEELRAPRITLKLDEFDFGRPAIEVVKARLAHPVPPRRVERAISLQLLDNAGRWRGPRT
jgi:hypothetical protein